MAILIGNSRVIDFTSLIVAAIGSGRIKSWAVVDTGLTCTAKDHASKAFFREVKHLGNPCFAIFRPKQFGISSDIYAVYHGLFIEMMLGNFMLKFSDVRATALPISGVDAI